MLTRRLIVHRQLESNMSSLRVDIQKGPKSIIDAHTTQETDIKHVFATTLHFEYPIVA